MAFHGLKQMCGQPGHSGLSSRPDRDRNEKAHCVQCSAESPAHSGCWEGPRGPGVPRLSPSPACPSTREGQDMGSGDRTEGELMRERGSPGTQGVASAELPHLHPRTCLEVYSTTSALAAPTPLHPYPSTASSFLSHSSINAVSREGFPATLTPTVSLPSLS